MRTLVVSIAAAFAASMLVACSAFQPHDTTVTLAHGLTVTLRGGTPKISAGPGPTSVTASLVRRLPVKLLAPVEQVTIAGKLPAGGAILTWRLNPKMLAPGMTPFVASLNRATGQWTALPGSYNRKIGAISARIPADPVVVPLGWIGSEIASMLQGALLSIFGLSGTGVYPQCSSYDVPITDSQPAGATIGFCAQPAGSSQVLVKLASMRPYPMDVTYPAGTSVSPSVLSRIIVPGSGRAILSGLDHIDAVLPLNPGSSTRVTVRLDGSALAAGLLGVAETLASNLGGKPKAILDAFENTKCFAHAVLVLDSVTEPSLRDAQDAGSTILECAGQALENSKKVGAIIGTAVIFAASLAGDAIFAAWGTIDKLMHDSDHVLTIQWPAQSQSAMAAFFGSWYVHDGSLCVGDSLVLPSSNTFPECSGAGNLGWMRWWMGCGSYPSVSVPVCNGWAELTFAQGPGSTIIGTVQKVFYTTENNAVISGYQQAGSLAAGDTFELQKLDTGLLKTTYLRTNLSKSDLKYGNPYWCGPGISQANQYKCGA
jgi:hypothetical protein